VRFFATMLHLRTDYFGIYLQMHRALKSLAGTPAEVSEKFRKILSISAVLFFFVRATVVED
jgi:hypothetical protein